jgi:hypothetical protein
MKRLLVLAAGMLTLTLAITAVGEDKADPTGTWKWKFFNQSAEQTMKLKLEGDKLTGSILRNNKEVPLDEATYKVGMLNCKVTVTSERGDPVKIIVKYIGTVSGDTLKGTIEFKWPDRTILRDWDAVRVEMLR